MLRRVVVSFGVFCFVGLLTPLQAKPQLNTGSTPPKTEFVFVAYPLGSLALTSGKGEIKGTGASVLLSSAGEAATFSVPLKGLKPGATVRITFMGSASSGSAVPGFTVDDARVGRGGTISSSSPTKGVVAVTLSKGEGSFSVTLEPSSKIRLDQLRAEVLK